MMDFDHVPERGAKKFNIASSGLSAGRNALKEELRKCDVVCCMCHRRRTYHRGQLAE